MFAEKQMKGLVRGAPMVEAAPGLEGRMGLTRLTMLQSLELTKEAADAVVGKGSCGNEAWMAAWGADEAILS
jgi:hypothetical protein